jgi:hypothetical protein
MPGGIKTPVVDKLREDVTQVPPGFDEGPPEFPRDPFGHGGDGGDRVEPPVSNAHLGARSGLRPASRICQLG